MRSFVRNVPILQPLKIRTSPKAPRIQEYFLEACTDPPAAWPRPSSARGCDRCPARSCRPFPFPRWQIPSCRRPSLGRSSSCRPGAGRSSMGRGGAQVTADLEWLFAERINGRNSVISSIICTRSWKSHHDTSCAIKMIILQQQCLRLSWCDCRVENV